MRELTQKEIEMVGGGELTTDEAAGLILTLGAIGTPATFAFALPIAVALYILS